MTHAVELRGCTAEPLVAYLKALGILRLVSEQVDRNALGWWKGDTFVLESGLDEQGLVDFFLKRYAPTPILAPWNKGSGFLGGRVEGLEAIARSDDVRFRDYREAIITIRGLTALREFEKGGSKESLVLACRNLLGDGALEWMDAAIILVAGSDFVCPPIFGTGGNDGNLDFTNTFTRRIAELLIGDADQTSDLFRNALFDARSAGFVDSPAGLYDPG